MKDPFTIPTYSDVREAMDRIRDEVHHTPVMQSRILNKITGSRLFFKCENFQRAGAFKYRGATHAIKCLSGKDPVTAVATHSSGNHAGALALAARQNHKSCFVVMPDNSPEIKIAAVREYGAEITFCTPGLASREEKMEEVLAEKKARFIHPYNNSYVIAGQGTAMLEFAEDIPDPDCIIAPVGGGGLLSGTALAAKSLYKNVKVYGAEPKGADDACRSLKAGKIIPSVNPQTMADGLLTSLGPLTFSLISSWVDDILTVNEEGIARAMELIWTRMKILVEPSAAVPLAAVLEHPDPFRGKSTGILLSGGNIDLKKLYGILYNPQLTG